MFLPAPFLLLSGFSGRSMADNSPLMKAKLLPRGWGGWRGFRPAVIWEPSSTLVFLPGGFSFDLHSFLQVRLGRAFWAAFLASGAGRPWGG